MDIYSIAEQVYGLAQLVYERVQETKANENRCKRLGERIKQIADSIRGLSDLPNTDGYRESLNTLLGIIKEFHDFAGQLSGQNWFRRAAFSKDNTEQLDQFNRQLADILPQLNLGLTVDMLIKREHELADASADRESILRNQEEIKRLNREMFEKLQRDMLTSGQLSMILGRQMGALEASLLWRVREMLADAMSPRALGRGEESKGEATEECELFDSSIVAGYHELVFGEVIGEGSFGLIHRGYYQDKVVAIKVIDGELDEDQYEQYVREVKIMSRLRSQYITQFYAASLQPTRACLVMEYMEKLDLKAVMSKEVLSRSQKMAITLQIAKGLQYLHSQGIVHADIKPENVLINDRYVAKWTDFGLSKITADDVKTYKGDAATLIVYRAPETFGERKNLTFASDLYGFGMLLWFLWEGKHPFAGLPVGRILATVASGARESLSADVPIEIQVLINQCWAASPSDRPSIDHVVTAITAASRSPVVAPVPVVPAPVPVPSAAPVGPRPDGVVVTGISVTLTAEESYLAGMQAEDAKDYLAARRHYEEARSKGYAKAFTNLGLFYLKGLAGLSKDKSFAYLLFIQAARAVPPHERAMVNLAEMLRYGDGVPMDLSRSLWWYQRFLSLGGRNEHVATRAQQLIRRGVVPRAPDDESDALLASAGGGPRYEDGLVSLRYAGK